MLVRLLTDGGRRDLLTPHFNFTTLDRSELNSPIFGEIGRLRYEVYCQECKYLDEAAYLDGLELDQFDSRSIHVAASNSQGNIVGTVRLVTSSSDEAFPFEEHCVVFPDFKFPSREASAEVSRLIVKKSYRRRAGDSFQGASREFQQNGTLKSIQPRTSLIGRMDRRSSSPQIMLGMYRSMYQYSLKAEKRYWYAAMERGLVALLRRMGFRFVPVGPEMDYYGPVATYMADLRELEDALQKNNSLLLAWLRGDPIGDWMLLKSIIQHKLG